MDKLCANCGMSVKAKSKWTKKDYVAEFDKLKILFNEHKELREHELEEAETRGYGLGKDGIEEAIQDANDDALCVVNEAWKEVIEEVKKHELKMIGGTLPNCNVLEQRVFKKLNIEEKKN